MKNILHKKRKEILSIMLLSLIGFGLFAQSLSNPVSAVYDKTNNRYLIANQGSNSIIAMDINRNMETFMDTGFFSIGRMTIVGNILYYIDGGKVIGLDLTDTTKTLEVIVGTNLSDIAADNSGNLYVGDNTVDMIYRILISTATVSQYMKDAVSEVTGLAYDKKTNRLLITSFKQNGPIESVNLSAGVISTLHTTNFPWISSIAVDKNGHIFVASQDSQAVFYYNADFSEGPIAIARNLSGVEDIYYNEDHDSLVIACSGDNTIKIVAVPKGTSIRKASDDYKISIYPNPATDRINIELDLDKSSIVSLNLTDMQGKVLHTETNNFAQGKNIISIQPQHQLPKGLYFISFDINGERSIGKIMIQ